MPNIIECKNVSFSYQGSKRRVLKEINLTVAEGEFLVITGPTGAGKSTLCQALNGIIPNFTKGDLQGEITVAGMNTQKDPVAEIAAKVGLVFQDPDAQLFGMTVEEDIVFGPSNLGYDYAECMRRIEKSLDDLNIRPLRDRKPQDLSGGQKQSVAIAGVYAMLPSVIIFDEPTSMLDPWGKKNVFSIIKDINKKYGVTIVLVEHEMSQIARYADRVVVMDHGRIVLSGSVEEVFAQTQTLSKLGMNIPQTIELGALLKNDGILQEIPLNPEHMIQALAPYTNDAKPVLRTKEDVPEARREPIICGKDLEFSYYGEELRLNRVNVEIGRGDFLAIIGQNGAGKTTLARSLIGLLKPQKGSIWIDGMDVSKKSVAELSSTIGYVFQNPDEQIFKDSVEEELYFGPSNLGRDLAHTKTMVEQVLQQVGLERYRNVWPKYLSKGERQRLTMGAIITMDPQIVIVDEPTTGQDWRETIWIMELLKSLNQAGKTIVIITHNMEIVNRYCSRVLVMKHGQILLDGPPKTVFVYQDVLKEAYVEPTDIMRIAQALPFLPDDVNTVAEFHELFLKALGRGE